MDLFFLPSGFVKIAAIGFVGITLFVGLIKNSNQVFDGVLSKVGTQRDLMFQKLDLMFVEIAPERLQLFYFTYLGVLFFLGAFLTFPNVVAGFFFGIIFIIAGWKLPSKVIDMLWRRRTERFVLQMVDGLSLMSNAMRSGLNVPQALQLVSDELPNPISQEFQLVLSQNKLGVTLEDALSNLAVRMPHDDIEMFTTSVNILRETGGNLAETFDKLSYTIRERIKVETKIGALTAQGVYQGVVVVAMPFVLGVIFYFIDKERVAPMFTTVPGWILLSIMISLQVTGGFIISKIVKVRV